jgi:hypothetical protein
MEKCIFFEEPTKLCDLVEPAERPCILNPNRFEKDMEVGNYSRAKVKPVGMYQIHIGKDDIAEATKHTYIEITPDGQPVKVDVVYTNSTGGIVLPVNNVVVDAVAVGAPVVTSTSSVDSIGTSGDIFVPVPVIENVAEIISTPSDSSISIESNGIPASGAEIKFSELDEISAKPLKNKTTIIK